jgi:chitin-binding protein
VGPEAQLSYVAGDRLAPSRPGSLALRRTGIATVQLKWQSATDNVGIAGYRVQVDGRAPIGVDRLSVTLRSLRKGTHVFVIWAVDAARNAGSAIQTTRRI